MVNPTTCIPGYPLIILSFVRLLDSDIMNSGYSAPIVLISHTSMVQIIELLYL